MKRHLIVMFVAVSAALSLGCGGNDDGPSNCGAPWQVLRFGEEGTDDFAVGENGLGVDVTGRTSWLIQGGIYGDFTMRLSFTDFETTNRDGWLSMGITERTPDISYQGIAWANITRHSSSTNVMATKVGTLEPDINFEGVSSDSRTGLMTISRRGNVLSVRFDIDFTSVSSEQSYDFFPDSELEVSIHVAAGNTMDVSTSVTLLDFTFEGTGSAVSDTFECEALNFVN